MFDVKKCMFRGYYTRLNMRLKVVSDSLMLTLRMTLIIRLRRHAASANVDDDDECLLIHAYDNGETLCINIRDVTCL